jgi:hypothetical protein
MERTRAQLHLSAQATSNASRSGAKARRRRNRFLLASWTRVPDLQAQGVFKVSRKWFDNGSKPSGSQCIQLHPLATNPILHLIHFSCHLVKREILPHHFRMSTFSSFQRQLNLYDFQRIAEGPEKGAYWHELFLKDQPMLSTGMKRIKAKGVTRARQEERMKLYHREGGHPPKDPHVGC